MVYFHKKFLTKNSGSTLKPDDNKFYNVSTNIPSERVLDKKEVKGKHQKAENNVKTHHTSKDKRKHIQVNESILQQTMKFAKDIVPLVMPPSVDGSKEAYYTVKSVKHKRTKNKDKEKTDNIQNNDTKSCIETYRKDRCFKESSTVIEGTGRMSSLQELKLSESLNCSLSEISNHNNKKKHHTHREQTTSKAYTQRNVTKLVASDSLQALAEGINLSAASGNQIQLHVMTDQDKSLLTEGVRNAVIRAVNDCIEEISKCKGTPKELMSVQKTVKYNSDKLDHILDRLSNIEVGIAKAVKEQTYIKPIATETKVLLRHKAKEANISTLEQLGEDILEKNISECEDNVETFNSYDTNIIHKLEPVKIQTVKAKSEIGNQGCGEEIPMPGTSSTDQCDTRQERTNRIPTRYCWTDVNSRSNRR